MKRKQKKDEEYFNLIDKISTLLEILNEKIDKKIDNIENKLEFKLSEIEKKVEENKEDIEKLRLNEKLESFKEDLEKINKIKNNLNLIKELKKKYDSFEEYILKVIRDLDDIKTEIRNLIFNLKDLYEFENKLDKLIMKINNWDKFFNIEEIEYNEDRIKIIKEWVEEQLRKGHDIEKIKEELIKNGYSSFFVHKVISKIKK